jgi:thioredoxin 1
MEGTAIPFSDPAVEDKLRRHGRVLLYFFSPHCGPCRAMTPTIERLAARHDSVLKLDVTQSADIARSLGILGTPSTVLLKDGKVAQMITGTASEKRLEALLAGD